MAIGLELRIALTGFGLFSTVSPVAVTGEELVVEAVDLLKRFFNEVEKRAKGEKVGEDPLGLFVESEIEDGRGGEDDDVGLGFSPLPSVETILLLRWSFSASIYHIAGSHPHPAK